MRGAAPKLTGLGAVSPLAAARRSLAPPTLLRGLRSRRILALPTLALAILGSGCAGRIALERDASAAARARIDDVPFIAQRAAQCGPAALRMALLHAGSDASESQVERRVFTAGRSGSLPLDLIGATRRLDHVAYPLQGWNEVEAALREGHPVVLLQNLGLRWIPRWHYSVLIGYDVERRTVTQHTGRYRARTTSLDTFLRTWERADRWSLVVLPPDRLPEFLGERRVLGAISALEAAGRGRAALDAYATARRRWPESPTAALGEGNAAYAEGALERAEMALRTALSLDPHNGPAVNNLAYVLADQGRRDEAIELLETELEPAGRWRATLVRSLSEIRQREIRQRGGADAPP